MTMTSRPLYGQCSWYLGREIISVAVSDQKVRDHCYHFMDGILRHLALLLPQLDTLLHIQRSVVCGGAYADFESDACYGAVQVSGAVHF